MKTYFRKTTKDRCQDELILFFCGWGLDEKPFNPLSSDCDILFVFDYCDLQFDFDFSSYKKITLIAFSYGVFMAAYLKDVLPKCELKIAINGTLKPLDEECGMPKEMYLNTLENMTDNTAYKFREKLFDDKDHLVIFNQNLPVRDLPSSLKEFAALKKYVLKEDESDFEYDWILIGDSDEIIPSKNQINYWQCKKRPHFVEGGHFLFYNFCNFEQIIAREAKTLH